MKTGMKMCRKCYKYLKDTRGYFSGDEQMVKQADCLIHPRLSNRRVAKCLGFFEAMVLERDGFRHNCCRGVRMVIEDGWTSLRAAKAVLFDYEAPFIDLLLKERFLEFTPYDGDPARVRPTLKGKAWLRKMQLELEAEKKAQAIKDKVQDKIEAERAAV